MLYTTISRRRAAVPRTSSWKSTTSQSIYWSKPWGKENTLLLSIIYRTNEHNIHDGLMFVENCPIRNLVKMKTLKCYWESEFKILKICVSYHSLISNEYHISLCWNQYCRACKFCSCIILQIVLPWNIKIIQQHWD